jgi:hypothetical protein
VAIDQKRTSAWQSRSGANESLGCNLAWLVLALAALTFLVLAVPMPTMHRIITALKVAGVAAISAMSFATSHRLEKGDRLKPRQPTRALQGF